MIKKDGQHYKRLSTSQEELDKEGAQETNMTKENKKGW
jgi:hypothetical protein